MSLDEILQSAGKHRRRKRLGRGTGSGRGKTCTRGHKGYYSRSGAKHRLGYEGGQTPLHERSPKRGFSNAAFRREFQVVNVASLEKFAAGDRVDAAALEKAGLIEDAGKPVKILGGGELTKKLTVVACVCSEAAAAKIAKAGGSVEQS
jgi:large subunit ribosomal protein L15